MIFFIILKNYNFIQQEFIGNSKMLEITKMYYILLFNCLKIS